MIFLVNIALPGAQTALAIAGIFLPKLGPQDGFAQTGPRLDTRIGPLREKCRSPPN